jgi:hypothetical protein
MSSEEEERLTYAQLCEELAKQNRARLVHLMALPMYYEIPLIVKRTMEDTVKNLLHLHSLPFEDYTEPEDTECYFLVTVSPTRIHILGKFDPVYVSFQTPDLLLPC